MNTKSLFCAVGAVAMAFFVSATAAPLDQPAIVRSAAGPVHEHPLVPATWASSPMADLGETAMWDPTGTGCIDGGRWEDPYPAGKGDIRPPPFCVARPCLRIMTPTELARDVFGRALKPEEWFVYLYRYWATCVLDGADPLDPVLSARNFDTLLGMDPGDGALDVMFLDSAGGSLPVPQTTSLPPLQVVQGSPYPAWNYAYPAPQFGWFPFFGAGGGSGGTSQASGGLGHPSGGGGNPPVVPVGTAPQPTPGQPSTPHTGGGQHHKPSGGPHPGGSPGPQPNPPFNPGTPSGGQPPVSAVPLPSSVILLIAALAALGLPGLLRLRRAFGHDPASGSPGASG